MSETLPKNLRLEAAFLQLMKHDRPGTESFLQALQDLDADLVEDFLVAPKEEIFQAQGALGMLRGFATRLRETEQSIEAFKAAIAANAKRMIP